MEVTRIIAAIDSQIAKLQQARALLSETQTSIVRGPGRPKSTTTAATPVVKAARRKRVLSAEARKRIADAQKRRWAEHRKATK